MERFCYGCMQKKQQSPVCEHCGFDETTQNQQHQLPVGTVLLNRYVIGRVLGQGGFGITYIGWDPLLEIPVAIKEYYPGSLVHRNLHYGAQVECSSHDREVFEKHRERFLKEARTMGQLSQVPEIVQVKNFFMANNTAYIVMEYIKGITLKNHLKALDRPMTVQETMAIMEPVLAGLEKVHENQLIHRDISPDNIMLPNGGGVKLIDFGTAKNIDNSMLSRSTEAVLKPGFAPIEQYNNRGNLGTWTDVYAICATYHYLLTGKLPPDSPTRIEVGETLPLLEAVPGISRNILKTLYKGMAIRPAERIQSVAELRKQLYSAGKIPAAASENTSKTQPRKKPAGKYQAQPDKTASRESGGKKKFLIPLLAALAAAVLTVAVFASGGKPAAKPDSPQLSAGETQSAEPRPAATNPPGAEEPEGFTMSVIAAEYSQETALWWGKFEKDFEKAYPHIDLKVDVVSWNDIYIVADTRIANGEAPCILNTDSYEQYFFTYGLLSATEYLSEETYAKFYPNTLEQFRFNDKILAVPDLQMSRALFCNADILKKAGVTPPTTWKELEQACIDLRSYDSGIIPFSVDMTSDDGYTFFTCFAWSNGGGLKDGEGRWAVNVAENAQTIRFLTALVHADLTNERPWTETRYEMREKFLTGDLAMILSPSDLHRIMETGDSNVRAEVVPVPFNGSGRSTTQSITDAFVVFDNGYTAGQLEAITCFFDFFYEDSRYANWVKLEGFLPATRTGMEQLASEDPVFAPWVQILENTRFLPYNHDGWQEVKTGIVNAMQDTLFGEDPQQLLDALQEQVSGR